MFFFFFLEKLVLQTHQALWNDKSRENNINTINIQRGHKVPLCYIQCKSLSQSSRYATMMPKFRSVCSQAVSFLSLLIQLSSSERSAERLHRGLSCAFKSPSWIWSRTKTPAIKSEPGLGREKQQDVEEERRKLKLGSEGTESRAKISTNHTWPPKVWAVTDRHR